MLPGPGATAPTRATHCALPSAAARRPPAARKDTAWPARRPARRAPRIHSRKTTRRRKGFASARPSAVQKRPLGPPPSAARGTECRRHPGRLFQTRRYKPPPAARRIRSPAGAAQAPRREVCRTRPAVRCRSPSARRPTPCDAVGGSIRSSAPLRSHPPPPPAAPRPAPAQGPLSQSPALPVPSCFSPVPPVCTKSSYNYYTAASFI